MSKYLIRIVKIRENVVNEPPNTVSKSDKVAIGECVNNKRNAMILFISVIIFYYYPYLKVSYMRRGKEFYTKSYPTAMELHKKGLSAKEIAAKLNISYSAVYHWVTKRRKPRDDNLTAFAKFLEANGPTPAAELKDFPKHSELFLTARQRGLKIRRYKLPRKFGEYSLWYFLDGQESRLKSRIVYMAKKREELKKKILETLGKSMS